jgi:hypothetical protein
VPSFPFLGSFASKNGIQLKPEQVANIKEHCANFAAGSKEYFTENLASEFWIRVPFSIEDILPESLTKKRKVN